MSDDLIQRLRGHAKGLRMLGGFAEAHLPADAADEIERLLEELAALRANQENVEATHRLTLREVQAELMRVQSENDKLKAQPAQEPVKYGCHCDLEEGMAPDSCVFDDGLIEHCSVAMKIQRTGKSRYDCEHWKPIQIKAQPAQEPVAWMREWEGDVSDLGSMIFAASEDEKDDNPHWIPLFAASQPSAEVEKDAARYRWLCNRLFAADFDYDGECIVAFKWPPDASIGCDLDDTIDAAMSKGEKA